MLRAWRALAILVCLVVPVLLLGAGGSPLPASAQSPTVVCYCL